MKKLWLLPVLAVLAAGCAEKKTANNAQPAGMVNPFKEVETAAEAAETAGFEITVPAGINGLSDPVYRVMEGMIEVVYEEGDEVVIVRKAPLKTTDVIKEDISGDYSSYEESAMVCGVNAGFEARMNNHLVNVARWDDGEYAYALVINPGTSRGLETSVIMELIESIR